jgi:lysophospholipase L1-like esterase
VARRSLALAVISLAAIAACAAPAAQASASVGTGTALLATTGPAATGPAATGPAATGPAVTGPAATGPAAKQYYLALGDSLANGAQPNHQGVTVPTSQGYPNQLDALLAKNGRVLILDDLGCIGETTGTLIHGGICTYPGETGAGTQLRAALDFLRTHAGHVPMITLDIGINNVSPCTHSGTPAVVDSCAEPLIAGLRSDTAAVLKALRAADPSAVIVGLDYYVPELSYWLGGSGGQSYATVMQSMIRSMNTALAADYKTAGARYADVFTAFKSGDLTDLTTLAGYGSVPVGVARICQWTWMCAAPPKNLNVHANRLGYKVIAQTIYAILPAAVR